MIGVVEDNLLLAVKDLFQGKLKTVEALPGDWDADMLKRLLIAAPAVYVAFTGGPKIREGENIAGIKSRWAMFALTMGAAGQETRRRGVGNQIGAYDIISRLLMKFDGYAMDGVGTMELLRIDNLYTGLLDRNAVSLYAMVFELPLYFDPQPDFDPDLARFETLHVDFDLAKPDGNIDGSTDIDLPQ